MSDAELNVVREQLGSAADALPELGPLAGDQLLALAELVEGAHARQADTLRAAMEEALEHVPRLLRGAVRKILFGK